ncbi:MAG: glutamate racemase [Dysgonamonadaceae bacterium]|jgi:glutamate racemase|nr:glutamate racemase [Dysgonamonadaceae bacterium]
MVNLADGPIGIFDSGYGGLTILEEIRRKLPGYDYLYLGDNARSPYGTRSFEVVYEFTLQAVKWLFKQDCRLIILACNTASAKALRTIQQKDLPQLDPNRRVLGVIRPTVECIGNITKKQHIGILATPGTITSESYPIEIKKLFPNSIVTGEACPMWVPLVENGEYDKPGADYFVKQNIDRLFEKDSLIDTLILACTHYPLLENKIQRFLPKQVALVSQGRFVAESLADYLQRHPEIAEKCSKNETCRFFTTESEEKFSSMASLFLSGEIDAKRIVLEDAE